MKLERTSAGLEVKVEQQELPHQFICNPCTLSLYWSPSLCVCVCVCPRVSEIVHEGWEIVSVGKCSILGSQHFSHLLLYFSRL